MSKTLPLLPIAWYSGRHCFVYISKIKTIILVTKYEYSIQRM